MSAEKFKNKWTLLSQKTKDSYKAYISAWEKSSLTQTIYCQKYNLNKRTFSYLRNQILYQRKNHQKKNNFIPIVPASKDTNFNTCKIPNAIMIRLANNTLIEVPVGTDQEQLAMVINLVRTAP